MAGSTTTESLADGVVRTARADARDIVVIGASAGGIEVLYAVVAGLPADLPGVVFVAPHLPGGARSALSGILSRAGPLPAVAAIEELSLLLDHLYVAPADHRHLIVRRGHLNLVVALRENSVCPAADPLFRSAARAYDLRVVGVAVSGTGADGTAGLRAIEAADGLAIVQDPTEARSGGMPSYAARFDDVDYVLPAAEIGPLLGRLAWMYEADCGPEDRPHANVRVPAKPRARSTTLREFRSTYARAPLWGSSAPTGAGRSARGVTARRDGSPVEWGIAGAASPVWSPNRNERWSWRGGSGARSTRWRSTTHSFSSSRTKRGLTTRE